ncbi:type 1 glutamine amidotransferase [Zavarzinia sp. CC-PAN008]|uniref:type 1 glutamine amidotransferase n=1 Tax=Zavarzinia sp. CC-PAN008 TaxID=3243332 RepID=UPI003F743182
MRILVFQHHPAEHPGIFREFLAADGIAWDAVELDQGQAIPDLAPYDQLWVMGGPMDVWEEDQHPWLIAEKAAIRAAVGRGMPYFGLCLGHQLLGDAMGGRVGKMAEAEVGILDIDLTPAGRADPLFEGQPDRAVALQWHGAAVLEAPPGAAVLASSPACAIQGLRVGARAYGLQYHVELTATTVADWGCVPEYAASLEASQGVGALARLDALAAAAMPGFARQARGLYDNFMAIAAH